MLKYLETLCTLKFIIKALVTKISIFTEINASHSQLGGPAA